MYYAAVYSLVSNIRIGRDFWSEFYVITELNIALYVVTYRKRTGIKV